MIRRPPCPNSKCPPFNIHPKPSVQSIYSVCIIYYTSPYFRCPFRHTFTSNSHAPPAQTHPSIPIPQHCIGPFPYNWYISPYHTPCTRYHHTLGKSHTEYITTPGITIYLVYHSTSIFPMTFQKQPHHTPFPHFH